MPIHTSWKSMAKGMAASKKYKKGTIKCRDFTDGSKVCMAKKAWNVFYASINKMGAKAEKPRPKSINETVFMETVAVVIQEIIEWAVTRDVK